MAVNTAINISSKAPPEETRKFWKRAGREERGGGESWKLFKENPLSVCERARVGGAGGRHSEEKELRRRLGEGAHTHTHTYRQTHRCRRVKALPLPLLRRSEGRWSEIARGWVAALSFSLSAPSRQDRAVGPEGGESGARMRREGDFGF